MVGTNTGCNGLATKRQLPGFVSHILMVLKKYLQQMKTGNMLRGLLFFPVFTTGEVYDASREQPGWNATGFDDSAWNKVKVYPLPEVQLKSHVMPAIKVNETITPKEISLTDKYIHVYDMGQNFTGWVRLKMKGKRNTRVIIRFAEDIHEDGTIDVSSNEHARATAQIHYERRTAGKHTNHRFHISASVTYRFLRKTDRYNWLMLKDVLYTPPIHLPGSLTARMSWLVKFIMLLSGHKKAI